MTDREIFEKETGWKQPPEPVIGSKLLIHERALKDYWKAYALWLQKRSEWVSVEERLPDNSRLLLVVSNHGPCTGYYTKTDGWFENITHQPIDVYMYTNLPTPPDEAKRGR